MEGGDARRARNKQGSLVGGEKSQERAGPSDLGKVLPESQAGVADFGDRLSWVSCQRCRFLAVSPGKLTT